MNAHPQTKPLLTIAHRVCPALSKTACGFTGKFEMVKACAGSMFAALEGIDCRMIVILDGCPDEYAALFPGAEIVRTDSIGNQATFGMQMDVLSASGSPFVYCSEDDYLYSPEAFKAMLEFVATPEVDFATPIDHPDRYNGTVSEPRQTEVRISSMRHWRECGTTCLTFMAKADSFRRAVPVLRCYVRGEQDSVAWLGVTKSGLFSPSVLAASFAALVRRMCRSPVWFGRFIPLMAWARHGIGLFLRRKLRLWSPMPSLAFHLSSNTVPPVVGAAGFLSRQ